MAFSLSRRLYIPPCRRRHAGLALAVNMQGCAALCTKRAAGAARLATVAFEATPAAAGTTAAMRTTRWRLTIVSSTRLLGQGHKGCGCESAALRRFFVPCLA